MDFRIADTFTDSLARLTGDEQKAVKTTAFDLQLNPANPGLSFHKLDKAKDKNFWSVRVNRDIRLIVHKTAGSLLLCYVDHHDKAYDWAERRKLETHPKTGAAQLVQIRETVQEMFVPVYVQADANAPPATKAAAPFLFASTSEDELLSYGVPVEWLNDVRRATEDTLLALADHLPAEAAEALLELATGGKPRPAVTAEAAASPFEHPDALRRFRVMTNVEELQQALEFPWEKWTIFLHPDQRQWVEREYAGPARVSGSAGTGKTVVALHRAVYLARTYPDARILLTTFSDTLASMLSLKLRRLLASEPRLAERIDVHSINAIGERLYNSHIRPARIAKAVEIKTILQDASKTVEGHKFSYHFLRTEWDQVVDAWRLADWAAYRDVARLGRKTRLPEPQRKTLWTIFENAKSSLRERGLITRAELFTGLAEALNKNGRIVFDHAVVDEAQDLSVFHLRFLAALGGSRPDALFFAGDLGQRIFQQPFSWKSLGVDIRGRSRTLRINYRTSHQIRSQADLLLDPSISDVDGNEENRRDTISVFNGPPPSVLAFESEAAEAAGIATWLSERLGEGVAPKEIGIFVRSRDQLERAKAAVSASRLTFHILGDLPDDGQNEVSVGIMHLAKGLEFRAVVVMACDDEIIPLQERIEAVGDDADLQEVYDTERHLLYVACTRARDHLLVTGIDPASEFLDDLKV